jgi:hypothetical protein
MNVQDKNRLQPAQEQIMYANLLVIGVWFGIAVLLLIYLIYVLGIVPPHVDITIIPQVWSHGVDEYLKITHSPHGWGWLRLLHKGDFLNYLGLALLGLLTIVCFMVLVRGYLRQRNWLFAVISIFEILVLSLAASGILGGGGH